MPRLATRLEVPMKNFGQGRARLDFAGTFSGYSERLAFWAGIRTFFYVYAS